MSFITLCEASRGLVACKGGGYGDLAVFGRFGVKNDPKKKFPNVFGDTFGGYSGVIFGGRVRRFRDAWYSLLCLLCLYL